MTLILYSVAQFIYAMSFFQHLILSSGEAQPRTNVSRTSDNDERFPHTTSSWATTIAGMLLLPGTAL
jgi:hypothetical protein